MKNSVFLFSWKSFLENKNLITFPIFLVFLEKFSGKQGEFSATKRGPNIDDSNSDFDL